MGNKAVFLDRDGTINIEKHYLYRIEDFEFLPGVKPALKNLQEAGYLLIIITNQSGIGRGYYSEEDFHVLNDWMVDQLAADGINISKVYYCPHLPDAKIPRYRISCTCRKPEMGMYERAKNEFDIDMEMSIAVGDKIRDCSICKKYSCKGYLIENGEQQDIISAVKQGKYENIRYAESLEAVANIIISTKVEE